MRWTGERPSEWRERVNLREVKGEGAADSADPADEES